jgi:cytochrome c oxidase cbb3-type subunit III
MSSPCPDSLSGTWQSRLAFAAALALTLLAGCEREERRFREPPSAAAAIGTLRLTDLQAGTADSDKSFANPYEENAYATSQGKQLFTWFNCNGCHAQGGGDSGPPLMDDQWIYGAEPANVFASIVEGRPNGMPSFRGKIADYQVWQLVAYVRSMSGLLRTDVAPGRSDHLTAKKPEQRKDDETPRRATPSKTSEQSQ